MFILNATNAHAHAADIDAMDLPVTVTLTHGEQALSLLTNATLTGNAAPAQLSPKQARQLAAKLTEFADAVDAATPIKWSATAISRLLRREEWTEDEITQFLAEEGHDPRDVNEWLAAIDARRPGATKEA